MLGMERELNAIIPPPMATRTNSLAIEVRRDPLLQLHDLEAALPLLHFFLRLDRLLVIHPGDKRYPLSTRVEAVPLEDLARPNAATRLGIR